MIGIWIRIGFRNLVRNRRRSLFTMVAVALGFAAVNLFSGFAAYVFTMLQEGFVHAYANGHLTVFRQERGQFNVYQPAEALLTADEVNSIRELCAQDPRIRMTSPQLLLTGLVSNGRISTVFAGMGRIPEDMAQIRAQARTFVGRLEMFDGPPLRESDPQGIGVSDGLAEKLEIGPGDPLILVATTAEGQMNALDARRQHLFDAPSDILRDMLLDLPLNLARELHDTSGADRVILLLQQERDTIPVRDDLQHRLRQAGLDVNVRTWQELCPSYFRLQRMFSVIFVFIFSIVFVIVALSVINTISMSVFERTREIGALRALGLKRRGVHVMFAAESGLLGLAGSFAGLLPTIATMLLLKLANVQWHPPVVSRPVPLEIHITLSHLALSMGGMVLLAIAAALLPSRRAARMRIVDALGHV